MKAELLAAPGVIETKLLSKWLIRGQSCGRPTQAGKPDWASEWRTGPSMPLGTSSPALVTLNMHINLASMMPIIQHCHQG